MFNIRKNINCIIFFLLETDILSEFRFKPTRNYVINGYNICSVALGNRKSIIIIYYILRGITRYIVVITKLVLA